MPVQTPSAMLRASTANEAIKRLAGSSAPVGINEDAASTAGKSRGAYTLQNRVSVPKGNAIDVIERLRPRAEAGDAEAALAIYMKLSACERVIEREISDAEMEAYRKMGAASGLMENALQQLKECGGAQKLLDEQGKWLEQAAEAGVAEAQLLFAADVKAVLGAESDMLRDPRKVQQYKVKAVRYLSKLAKGGNVEAMLSLAGTYDNGILSDRDPFRSYVYSRAAQLAVPELIPTNLVEMRRRKVPVDQWSRAEQAARRFYSQCCGN